MYVQVQIMYVSRQVAPKSQRQLALQEPNLPQSSSISR
jgi:hypothetical protein